MHITSWISGSATPAACMAVCTSPPVDRKSSSVIPRCAGDDHKLRTTMRTNKKDLFHPIHFEVNIRRTEKCRTSPIGSAELDAQQLGFFSRNR